MLLQDDGVGVSTVTEKQVACEIYAGHIYSIEGRVDNQSASVGTKCAGTHITGGPLIRRCLADGCEYARHGCNDAQSVSDIAHRRSSKSSPPGPGPAAPVVVVQ